MTAAGLAGRPFSATRTMRSLNDALPAAHLPRRDSAGVYFNYINDMVMIRPPRGGGIFIRPTGAACWPRIWAKPGFSDPKALAGVCGEIAELATSIATPAESDLGESPYRRRWDFARATRDAPVFFRFLPALLGPCGRRRFPKAPSFV